jgi:hypothetical protein
MMAEGKIIDVAVKKTNHSMHLPKQSHETKSQEFPEHFHSFTDIIYFALANALNDLSFLLPHQLFYLQPSFCI